ncbi:methyltransferase domain-containing protein [Gammaproteobacteria bacterium]|jgi:phospholipid N-methyltransferase|nr:methyltransferase domain-containing protein [Gammaproteobacteria bacterium]MBT6482131.1 methyltransferase domain-containing protein [Gammaproteobacteria bacterium]MBT7226404.1 methyltransferase domain-containing protein [Gammaproteobacteria bacterium]MDC3196358.1 methyltransferase domain-containing protein [Gammaproteobacteria bacterium]
MNAKFKFNDSLNLIKSFKTSGTITPSSKSLIKTLLAPIDFKSASCIIELGPGTGCVTRSLLERMSPDCVLICFEVNEDFIEQLTALQDSRLRVVNACASSIRTILDELSIEDVDHIVSSLPLALIEDQVVKNILESVRSNLCEGGRFLQYQYSLNNYAELKPIFKAVKLDFTFRNMPPAFVYECIK